MKSPGLFVYVIGLHAVQFGNNWIQKILRTANLAEFFESNYFQIGQACSRITY